MRRFTALFASLALTACVTGIPDADSSIVVPKREPCEIWVTVEPEHVRTCISRAHWERDFHPTGMPGAY